MIVEIIVNLLTRALCFRVNYDLNSPQFLPGKAFLRVLLYVKLRGDYLRSKRVRVRYLATLHIFVPSRVDYMCGAATIKEKPEARL
jgi:hypothetical protein